MYRILYEETQAEIVEKKSRFIAYLKPVHSEEEAASFIEGVKKSTGMPGITVRRSS